MKDSSRDISTQTSVGAIQYGLDQQELLKKEALDEIFRAAIEKTVTAQQNLSQSYACIERVRDFVSKPEGILGSMATKHGEIAEHIEVEIRNGRDILNSLKPKATFDGVGRTAPEDYVINGINVQSKFTNHFNKSLKAVIEHLETYPNFTDKGFYHIPKDQFEIIQKISNGETVTGVSSHSLQKCKELISTIESKSSKSFSEVVFPGSSNYSEVQLGVVDETLDSYDLEFTKIHKSQVKEIRKERKAAETTANHITDYSLKDAVKYGAISAIITGGVSATIRIYSKIKEGKTLLSFTTEDWKDIGIDFGKNSLKGGISGFSIYTLTKSCNFSAPFAGAVASAGIGVASLYSDYRNGKLSEQEFSCMANSICVESAFSAVGAALGQTIIPIPVLGAVVGAAASKSALEIVRYFCHHDEKELINRMENDYNLSLRNIEAETRKIILKMDAYFERLDGFIEAALSIESAARLTGSIELCRFLKVPEDIILHSTEELDEFMYE